MEARTAEIVIERLGAKGDGIGHLNGTPVFVPATLPGERVLVRVEGNRGDGLTASVVEWQEQASDRAKPPCRHFGICGGCVAQHMKDATYVAWKRGIAVEALARAGISEEKISPLMRVPAGTRRRATFAFRKNRDGVTLGFNGRASHHLVDLQECPQLDAGLTGVLPMLRQGLGRLFSDAAVGDLSLQLTDSGLDVLIRCESPLDLFKRESLAKLAEDMALARLSWQGHEGEQPEPVAERKAPSVILGGVPVAIPAGCFLQPSKEGEAAIAAQVLAGVSGLEGAVADLYAGVGSFSLPLAALARVHAVEGDAQAAGALKRAGEMAGLSQLSVERRDLRHRPLLSGELDKFEGAVIDPPRAGAREQVSELALTRQVKNVVMVSCNPVTLARDLALLLDEGWSLDSVVPIDQFLWTPHLELTALLHRTTKNS
ncbi:MAG: class I SAM-dependent RNA methyltransferase [Rhodospirillales bacterium]|jgi:23S rRNA (uracil1939-C5)-methyltransferase